MASITIGGTEYKLTFTMDAFEKIEDEIGMVDELTDKLTGKGRVRTVRRLLQILSGGEITEEIIARKMIPAQIAQAITAIWAAIGEGMSMETTENQGEEEEVDVALQEIEKKETGDG